MFVCLFVLEWDELSVFICRYKRNSRRGLRNGERVIDEASSQEKQEGLEYKYFAKFLF